MFQLLPHGDLRRGAPVRRRFDMRFNIDDSVPGTSFVDDERGNAVDEQVEHAGSRVSNPQVQLVVAPREVRGEINGHGDGVSGSRVEQRRAKLRTVDRIT